MSEPISRRQFVSNSLKVAALGAIAPIGSLDYAGTLSDANSSRAGAVSDSLAHSFQKPPESARAWTWWHWVNGNVSKEGITADLEAMKRVGIAGFYNFHVGVLPIEGPATFGSAQWWELSRFAAEEAERLGLTYGFHNCPGWSSSGGPWMKVEQSMQKIVWSEARFTGPGKYPFPLPQPEVDKRWNYYQDIAVLLIPDQAGPIRLGDVVDLSGKLDVDGKLGEEIPSGKWIILRFGHTTTGSQNTPAPKGGVGLECDKLSREAVETFFKSYPEKYLANAGPAAQALKVIAIDSYERGPQDWTPAFREEFQKRRGYDLLPWLPVWAKQTIESSELSERFRNDMKQTVADLFDENYYGFFAELVHRHPNLQLAIEPYEGPFDSLTVAAHADIVMCEFWEKPCFWGWDSVDKVVSAAHTLGKRIVASESFTGWPNLAQWKQDPYALKTTGDRAYCAGVNQLVLHTSTHQPWLDVRPGLTMGWFGTHFERTQTWWEQSKTWFDYLARCQFLLQQGEFVSDVLFLAKKGAVPDGYKGDACSDTVLLHDLTFKDGKLVLSHGKSYRLLVISDTSPTPAIARKIRELAEAGATIIGPRFKNSPSLQDYPACDTEVAEIAGKLWDFGKISQDKSPDEALKELNVLPDFVCDASNILWIHRQKKGIDAYFVSNQEEKECTINCSFRITGKQPELWDAATGEVRLARAFQIENGLTHLPLKLDPSGSTFVIFRQPTSIAKGDAAANWNEFALFLELAEKWTLHFDPKWGGPGKVVFAKLEDWAKRPENGIRYYSGTVNYETNFMLSYKAESLWLDLGNVKNIAEVELNGKPVGILWKPPFRVDISGAVKKGRNRLVVKVTNLWPNRLIGDEQEPSDLEWGKEDVCDYCVPPGPCGAPLKSIPDWLVKGKPRPSPGRYTFTSWNFYKKDSPLLESGLLGPVTLAQEKASQSSTWSRQF